MKELFLVALNSREVEKFARELGIYAKNAQGDFMSLRLFENADGMLAAEMTEVRNTRTFEFKEGQIG